MVNRSRKLCQDTKFPAKTSILIGSKRKQCLSKGGFEQLWEAEDYKQAFTVGIADCTETGMIRLHKSSSEDDVRLEILGVVLLCTLELKAGENLGTSAWNNHHWLKIWCDECAFYGC